MFFPPVAAWPKLWPCGSSSAQLVMVVGMAIPSEWFRCSRPSTPSYVCWPLIDGGNPWSLPWRPPAPDPEDHVLTLQAMAAIQNLAGADFLWFLNNSSLYRPVPEQQGLEAVIDSLGGSAPLSMPEPGI